MQNLLFLKDDLCNIYESEHHRLLLLFFQLFQCDEIPNQILKELYPDFQADISNFGMRDDIIVKNKRFVITDLSFYKINFNFYNKRNIDLKIEGLNCFLNFDVYPNPGNWDVHSNHQINLKDFRFSLKVEFIRDTNCHYSRYRPFWTNYFGGFDLEPVSIDDNIPFVEYVREDFYVMKEQIMKKLTDSSESILIELIARLYERGLVD